MIAPPNAAHAARKTYWLAAALICLASAPARPDSAAGDWPFDVAPAGCRFDWEGPGGYRETVFSHCPARFPVIAFSRADWGPKIHAFTPFCGDICDSPRGRQALRRLHPLNVGHAERFVSNGHVVALSVESEEQMPHLGHVTAFKVRTQIPGRDDTLSWWSPQIGWLVKFETGNHVKAVMRVDCPGGMVLPEATS